MFWFYKEHYDYNNNIKYVRCNSLYAYLKLFVIFSVIYLCGKNQGGYAGVILVLYMILYFVFLVTQKNTILEISKVKSISDRDFEYEGSRYSFKNPYTIIIKYRRK